MGIVSSILAESRAEKVDPKHPRDPALFSWFGGRESAAGVLVNDDAALSISTFYAGVRLLAETMAAMPLFIYRRLADDGRERDPSHELFDLLRHRPNRWQTAFEFKEMLMGHLLLRGNAYAEIISTGQSAASELWPLHPDRVRPFRAPDGRIAYDHQPEKGPPRILLQNEVLHLRGIGSDGIVGWSPIRVQREALGFTIAADRYGARLFANDASPRGALKFTEPLDDETEQVVLERWNRRHQGVDRTGKVAIFEAGMEWQQIGLSAEDAQFLETRKHQAIEMARVLRIPPHLLGIMDSEPRANVEAQGIEYVTYSLLPWIERWRQAIWRDLFTPATRQTHLVDFEVNALTRGNRESRFKTYAIGRQWGIYSVNDCRRLENLNPVEGGDVYLSPMNMTPMQLLEGLVEDKLAEMTERIALPRPKGKPNGAGAYD